MVSRAWFDRPVVTLQSPPILADIAAAQGHNNLWCDTHRKRTPTHPPSEEEGGCGSATLLQKKAGSVLLPEA